VAECLAGDPVAFLSKLVGLLGMDAKFCICEGVGECIKCQIPSVFNLAPLTLFASDVLTPAWVGGLSCCNRRSATTLTATGRSHIRTDTRETHV